MTPEEFKRKMMKLHEEYKDDEELVHVYMDHLLCEVLEDLGYAEGIAIYKSEPKWYA